MDFKDKNSPTDEIQGKKAIEKNSLMTKFEDENIWRKIVLRMG